MHITYSTVEAHIDNLTAATGSGVGMEAGKLLAYLSHCLASSIFPSFLYCNAV